MSSYNKNGMNHRQQCRIVHSLVALLFVAQFWESCLAFTTTIAPASMLAGRSEGSKCFTTAHDIGDIGDDRFENIAAAVIVPGFLTGADEFGPLCRALTAKGIPTVAVPMPNWHWIPCLGGRSARPILERIDFTVRHLVANLETTDNAILSDKKNAILNIPKYSYSLWDCWQDFQTNPGGVLKAGGSSVVDEYPVVDPKGNFPKPENHRTNGGRAKKKIALIGHSAGGWISRVYLSSSEYGGKAYQGSDYIHSLVTLGSPHSDAPGPAFDGIQWINHPQRETDRLQKVRSLSVAGNGFRGDQWGDLTLGAYGFCCPDGTDGTQYDGDGVTPVFSALGMPQSDSLILDNVTHFCWSDVFGGDFVAPELTEDHRNGKQWYGSDAVIDQWAAFIQEASSTSSMSSTSTSTPVQSENATSKTTL